MPTQQNIPALSIDFPGSPAEIAEAGRQMEGFLESDAYRSLGTAIRAHQGNLTSVLLGKAPSENGAPYADVVGQLKGVAMIEPILRGVIASGKQAEAQLREAEEGGPT